MHQAPLPLDEALGTIADSDMTALLLTLALAASASTSASLVPGSQAEVERPPRAGPHELARAPREAFLQSARALEPRERVRALHDWLVLHLAYGGAGLPQDLEHVLARGTATCDGFSTAFSELGRRVGLEVVTIQGLLRVPTGPPQAHAWNAVRLDGTWQLTDVTLDDPVVSGDATPESAYRTDYLLVPPELAALDHFPFQARWQLGAPRPTRGAFTTSREWRSVVTVRAGLDVAARREAGSVTVEVKNLRAHYVILAVDGVRCTTPTSEPTLTLICPAGPQAKVEVLINDAPTGLFLSVLQVTDLEAAPPLP